MRKYILMRMASCLGYRKGGVKHEIDHQTLHCSCNHFISCDKQYIYINGNQLHYAEDYLYCCIGLYRHLGMGLFLEGSL